MAYVIEKVQVIGDYKYVVIFGDIGHRCGYIALKPDHPLFGVKYSGEVNYPELLQEIKSSTIGKKSILSVVCWDGETTNLDLLIDVHGGLTYSGGSKKGRYPMLQFDEVWWLGFDCGHYGDGQDLVAMHKHFPKRLKELGKFGFWNQGGLVRSLEYVSAECERAIQQLKCVEDTIRELTNANR